MSRRIHLLSTGESGSFPSFPFMDEQTLVPTSNGIGNRDPVYSTQGEVSANISGGPPAPPGGRILDFTNRLEVIRGDLSSKDISSGVVELLAGVRPTTQTVYQSAWSSWCSWCAGRRSNPLSATINDVLEFLGRA